jgi:cobalt/nickel transport system permease protein
MHISEGVLSAPVLLTGGALTAAGTIVGLKKTDMDKVAHVGIFSATFFVASLVHINIGPSSVHLILNGLIGVILGWAAVPAILVALLLQSVFFQFGGITALGVNTVNVALPGIIIFYLLRPFLNRPGPARAAASFAAGAGTVFLTAFMVALALIFTEESFWEVSIIVVTAHIPVMIIEGIVTVFCISFLMKVRPEVFQTVQDPAPLIGRRKSSRRA